MSSVKDVSDIPTGGKDLVIVAAVNGVLHFRLFDGDGKAVVDIDENRLTEQAQQIKDLRKQLDSLWPHGELTSSERGRVISAVTSIVGHTLSPGKNKVDVHLEIAKVTEKEHGPDAARKILERELKTAPDSLALNDALVSLELRTGHVDQAIAILQRNLKTSPYLSQYRWILANILAERGDNQGLASQIEELKGIGFPPQVLAIPHGILQRK